MAAILIAGCSIDLTKIDKSRIVEGKNGGKFYGFDVIVKDDFDQYKNNVQVIEKQTAEERQAKDKRKFLGNGRTVWQRAKEDAPKVLPPKKDSSIKDNEGDMDWLK